MNIVRSAPPLLRTPDQILGPFYPLNGIADRTGDLARSSGRPGHASGEILMVQGHVLTLTGRPVAGARIEIWQANSAGKYRHPSDKTSEPLDPNFDGFAVLTTDQEGGYSFRTVKPGGYRTPHGDLRPPHIHFLVDFGADRLITQMYFAGEPANATDRWLRAAPQPDLLIVSLEEPAAGASVASRTATFNIVLQID
ncbi:protocatechuate 3,4-dioxygenase [Bradyrhizobium sp. LTSPM299]|uniref:dioxygenase family protein n=1 Tax=Bradyrhizobium sp. LTSPM299 TaxID=1619233 RepID=UPI0005C960BD|nr:protocatechuate 3,4-dioxygenase [Bradyrhizobium sp. LTSPM299]